MNQPASFVLRLRCTDRVGIVAAVVSMLAEHGAGIHEISETAQPGDGGAQFFMRLVFKSEGGWPRDEAQFAETFAPIAQRFSIRWDLTPSRSLGNSNALFKPDGPRVNPTPPLGPGPAHLSTA